MTTSPNSPDAGWVLEASVRAAPAADPRWNEQLDSVRSVAQYDGKTQTWCARLGVLDLAGLQKLQILFDAARTYGTEVRLAPAPVPAAWAGPVFTRDSELNVVLAAQADQGRALGQLPLA
ncbi:hypothetical protein ACH419_30570 [Streptomyces bobili]|uniref:hypothetical protein n=1 Tax=Streptomyces bobili TaxID=67280 RepID=UPI00378D3016